MMGPSEVRAPMRLTPITQCWNDDEGQYKEKLNMGFASWWMPGTYYIHKSVTFKESLHWAKLISNTRAMTQKSDVLFLEHNSLPL
jgi:hypothetical protein